MIESTDTAPLPSEPHPAAGHRQPIVRGTEIAVIATVVLLDQTTKTIVRAMLPLTGHVTIIPSVLDFTHVQNTGAAFGLLNAADFPYKSGVMIVIAALALIAISLYARQLGSHERLSRYGLALILGGAFGNLIDRTLSGTSSTSSTCIGATRISGRSTSPTPPSRSGPFSFSSRCWASDGSMHPILFEVGGFTIYSYGVLLAAAYLLGLQFARARARARGLDAQRVMDLGIWIIISALVGAKLLLFLVDFRQFTGSLRDFMGLARSGGVFYGGLIAAVGVAFFYIWRFRMPLWTTTDVFAPGIALGHAIGRMGCLLAGCCFGRADLRPVGNHLPQTRFAAANVGTPLGIAAAPDADLRSGRRAGDPGRAPGHGARGHRFAGRTFWTLPVALRRVAVRHRVLPRRPSRPRVRRAVDVAVRVARPRAALDCDAHRPQPASGSRARGGAQHAGRIGCGLSGYMRVDSRMTTSAGAARAGTHDGR